MSAVHQVINIVFRIETDALQQNYPHPSQDPLKPTTVSSNEAYFIASSQHYPGDEVNTSEITLHVTLGDILRWNTSISMTNGFFVIPYNVRTITSTSVNPARLLSTFKVETLSQPEAIPRPDFPSLYVSTPQYSYYCQNQTREYGKNAYALYFYLVVAIEGKLTTVGYYAWNFDLNLLQKPV